MARIETSKRDVISVKVDRKRKLPVTILLRAILAWQADEHGVGQWVEDKRLVDYGLDEQIVELLQHIDSNPDHAYLRSTLDKDSTSTPAKP